MIAVIGRVEDVGIIQLSILSQPLEKALYRNIDTLQRLQPFRHQQIGKTVMNGLHLIDPAQDPLLIGIGREIVGRRAMARYVEEHVRVLRRRVFGTVRRRVAHDQQEGLVVVLIVRLVQEAQRVVGDEIRVVVG